MGGADDMGAAPAPAAVHLEPPEAAVHLEPPEAAVHLEPPEAAVHLEPPEAAVRLELDGPVARLTMAQPETRNALTPELLDRLFLGLRQAERSPGVRVVVLSHEGPVFCAGADLRTERAPTAQGGGQHADLPRVLSAIQDSALPVVARIVGACLGGGVGLAAACDLSVASEDVRIGFSEVRLGVAPAVVSVVCLPKLRRSDALALFLTGERVPAGRAAELGLITRAVPASELDTTVAEIVATLCLGGPGALAAAKQIIYTAPGKDRSEAYQDMSVLSDALFASDEAAEGRAAFRGKRPPSWALPEG